MNYSFYDFNGTIYDGNVSRDLILFYIKKRPSFIIKVFYAMFLYALHIIDKKKYRSILYSFIKNIDNLEQFIIDFWDNNEYKIKSFWLNKKNHKKDIILSNAGYFVLNYIVKKYSIGDLISIEYNLNSGECLEVDIEFFEAVNNFCKENKIKKDVTIYLPVNYYEKIDSNFTLYYVCNNDYLNFNQLKPRLSNKIKKSLKKIHNNREVICYLIAGFLTVIVNLLSKLILLLTIFNENNSIELQITIILSWIIAVVFAYFINRIYVFKSTNEQKTNEFLLFIFSRISTLILEMILSWILITLFNLNASIMIILIQIIIIIANYVLSKLFVFSINKK